MPALDTRLNEKDALLLQADKYTFSVLHRILQGPCDWVRTDHERLILCHSEALWPIWIWMPDGASEAERARAFAIVQDARPLAAGYRYNLKHELAEDFIPRARALGVNAGISMNLLAYACPAPVAPAHPADGQLYVCTEADVDEAARLLGHFQTAVQDGQRTEEKNRIKAADYISHRAFFLWKNREGRTVACCSCKQDDHLMSLSSVFTLPAFRRRHYAQSLVYQVTTRVAAMGFEPMLYTDGDYVPSNACYEKIGYVRQGSLCTLAAL